MKRAFMLFFLMGAAAFGFGQTADAHVTDETKGMSVHYQAGGEEIEKTPVATYKGTSGVVIESYSSQWKDQKKLAALEAELLKNKHGEEYKKLGKVLIYPDYPAGKRVVGQYFAKYQFSGGNGYLLPDRVIHLYGGDDFTDVSSVARTLSHEYGHHLTFYLLIEKEDLDPDQWLESDYAKARELAKYPKVHTNPSGAYEWYLPEVLAEDYVQLLGSREAVKETVQFNGELPTPFDLNSLEAYWGSLLGKDYAIQKRLSLQLTDYREHAESWDFQLATNEETGNNAYLSGQAMSEFYPPVSMGELGGTNGLSQWYSADEFHPAEARIFTDDVAGAHYRLIQHEANGFNKGSKTLSVSYQNVEASVASPVEPSADEETFEELSITKKKELITAAAKKYDIPAEILKAIAYNESGMNQFEKDGTALITDDGGMGMMQVTLSDEEMQQKGISKEKLITDTAYNVEIGARILKEKWNWTFIPRINEHNSKKIEHWYFAIMAYNGLSMRNDPNNEQGKVPYQEKIFKMIEDSSLVDLTEIPAFEVEYLDPSRPELMSFPKDKLSYKWKGMDTKTSHLYQKGEAVYTWNHIQSTSNLRDGVDGNRLRSLPHYIPLTIASGPYESANPYNHFVYYEVKGENIHGYIASSLLQKGEVKVFSDVNREEVRLAVAYLQVRDILNGYHDGTFKPNEPLLRRHAAAILVKELGLTLPAGYETKDKTVDPNSIGYKAMVIAEAHGLMGKGDGLRPNENLTRAQMASILVRAYGEYLENPTTKAKFTDIDESFWNYKDINVLGFNEITVRDAYGPSEKVTRSQFALFLQRVLERK
ncbi:hypothetical protein NCCP133_11310 [Cytobacillus sp. NCCP-133]|nr:hypothetical protein NCCP133_11310 [Cytobacillus sp. NCCP-133]